MIYFIEAMGIRQAQTRFTRMKEARIDATPVMETLADTMMVIIDKIFTSQGRRGGGSWKRDSPEWLSQKVRLALDPRIGYATHDLVRSMTERGNENQVLEITPSFIKLGSALPYADVQNRERPFTKFTHNDRLLMRMQVRDYLMAAWKMQTRPNVHL